MEEQNTSGDGIQAGLCVLFSVTLDKSLPCAELEFPHRRNEGVCFSVVSLIAYDSVNAGIISVIIVTPFGYAMFIEFWHTCHYSINHLTENDFQFQVERMFLQQLLEWVVCLT